ncbi:ROK family transcriptional regulator [Gymnodinialimonas ceratoperidinii]|uniref:ROK family transcriptional regulator n=1 Tax=Gymnodinialimonas ceratoperidinii TaxID=2856823 RepID=A0A8F6YBH7_9RHOB|nr:ROK family transcriptional regulator [Gymnodinialimonas ceratoperidinii]QXT38215.1 ROK family transcriptional regulator [Gymnodinialimonas ceratoperidinii]
MVSKPLPPGSNAERSRTYNIGLVLGHLHREGEAGRAEIARASGLSTQAVSNIIAHLLDEGWVEETGRRAGQRGLPAVTYAIRCGAHTALGVEIRPDAVLAAWIDLGGPILHKERIALPSARPEDVLPIIAQLPELGARAGVDHATVIGAGVVMPGPVGQTGLSDRATQLPGWGDVAPEAALADALGVAIKLENDANAAAMAERILGAAQGLGTFACLYFGAGVGLGLVHEGVVFSGAFGNAGEIGHIPVVTAAGQRSLESQASRVTLVRALAADGIDARTVADLTTQYHGRPAALSTWLDTAAEALGQAVQVIENMLDPETIVMTGALPAPLLAELVDRVPLPELSVSNRADRARPRLVVGQAGPRAATLGAAALVVNSAISPRLVDAQ